MRGLWREMGAEFFGTLVLIAFGCGVNTAVTFGGGDFGDFLSVNIGWGVAVILGVYCSGGVSGGHLNPAVTIALATYRTFPWSKVLPYIVAQVAGAFLGAALVYGTYFETFEQADPERSQIATTGVFCTYPRAPHVSGFPGGMIDQVVGTALLMTMVLAVGDKRNLAPDPKMAPLIVGLTVLGIGLAFGSNAGYAINPARDFGPRLLAFAAGWHDVFSASNYYFWIPIVGPILGAAVGAFFYDLIVHDRHPGGGDRE